MQGEEREEAAGHISARRDAARRYMSTSSGLMAIMAPPPGPGLALRAAASAASTPSHGRPAPGNGGRDVCPGGGRSCGGPSVSPPAVAAAAAEPVSSSGRTAALAASAACPTANAGVGACWSRASWSSGAKSLPGGQAAEHTSVSLQSTAAGHGAWGMAAGPCHVMSLHIPACLPSAQPAPAPGANGNIA